MIVFVSSGPTARVVSMLATSSLFVPRSMKPRNVRTRCNQRVMKIWRTALAAALLCPQSVQAGAKFLDGDTLHDWCLSAEVGDQEACLGYVIGVADALGPAQESDAAARHELCLPEIEPKSPSMR